MFENVRINRSDITPATEFPEVAARAVKPGMLITNGIVAVWVESVSRTVEDEGSVLPSHKCRFLYSVASVTADFNYVTFSRSPKTIPTLSNTYNFGDTFYVIWGA